MNTDNTDPTRREELLFMLLHSGAQSESIAKRIVDLVVAEAQAEPTPELSLLRAESSELDDLRRLVLPKLHREIEHHKDGKARWRARAEKAEARLAEMERPSTEAERNALRQSFMELAVQAREDRDYEGQASVELQLREREEQWKREDEAGTATT